MGYDVDLTDKAWEDLSKLPPWLQGIVESHLGELAKSPSALSRKVVSPPYPPGGMMSEEFYGPIDQAIHHVVVLFHFSSDEVSLIVTGIGYTQHPWLLE